MTVEELNRYDGQPMLIIGLGASGVSVLRYLVREGARVVVTDSRAAPAGIDVLQKQYPQVEFRLGAFDAPRPLTQFSEAVVSPGVSLGEPFVSELQEAGVALIGDIELFARAVPETARVIGITGSNGKSTVTTLVGEMAVAADIAVAVGGNLGTPALDLLSSDAQLYVLELSSFQLETTHSLQCVAAAFLNLSEDHLDRHGTLENYAAIKSRIFRRCVTAVINRDDAATALGADQAGRISSFGLNVPEADAYGLIEEDGDRYLCRGQERLCTQASLKIKGLHNLANALAALALAEAANIPLEAGLLALSVFPGCHIVVNLSPTSRA